MAAMTVAVLVYFDRRSVELMRASLTHAQPPAQ